MSASMPADAAWVSHALHAADAVWPETNCYIDVWIELLHSRGLNPLACLPVVFANDFEGDHWTFFKPAHADLFTLYGVDVQELHVWRSLLENATLQLARGRVVLCEVDAFHLPDTSGTDYQQNHVKTTIAMVKIDAITRQLGYFHNRAYHRLAGEDFTRMFRLDVAADPSYMPFFAEFVKFDRLLQRDESSLAAVSAQLLHQHAARRPQHNPMPQFETALITRLEQLQHEGLAAFHAYAFANLRQLGAGYSLGGQYLDWLQRNGIGDFNNAAQGCAAMSETCRILLMKTARAVVSKRAVDLLPLTAQLTQQWQHTMTALERALAETAC
ncbi:MULTISPECIES: DUF1839 family protein [unclassified Undibacterium]|uniref:DUF1839 family protein n=2 Tax=unclassified Undibacterium TaxID=2630295 RepID=UPI002B23C497|nr:MULTISPECIES: DUF1839 family protein [unclassified Undibacterium]